MNIVNGQVQVVIDPADLPQGLPGKDNYQLWLDDGHVGTLGDFLEWNRQGLTGSVRILPLLSVPAGANTSSLSYASTGLAGQITVATGEAVKIEVSGRVGNSVQNIVHFTITRDSTELTPVGQSGLDSARIDSADCLEPFSITVEDSPPAGLHTYTLSWKNQSVGTAYLGKRTDSNMKVPTTMSITARK